MINLKVKKRNLIALALAGALVLTGGFAYRTQAAGYIDTDATTTIQVTIPGDVVTELGGAEVKGHLYKIGDISNTGSYSSSIIDTDQLTDKTSAETMMGLAGTAKAYIEANKTEANYDFNATSGQAITTVAQGLYLVTIDQAKSSKYTYDFASFILSAPQNNYYSTLGEDGQVIEGFTNDNWNYGVEVTAKAQATRREGKLIIEKTLPRYNSTNGTAAFTYTISYTEDGKEYSKVISLDMNKAGVETTEEISIPSDIEVTVTESYTGASYTMTYGPAYSLKDDNGDFAEAANKIVADSTLKASFTNDYDGRNNHGGSSVVNHFERVEQTDASGNVTYSYEYKGNNLKTDSSSAANSQAE